MRMLPHITRIVFNLFLIVGMLGTSVRADQKSSSQKYFKSYPATWTDIASTGHTIVDFRSQDRIVSVNISTKTLEVKLFCKYDYCFDIKVNGREILVPDSVYSSLEDLNRAKVFQEGEKLILMINGGDAASSYYVKIEFNGKRVTHKAVYADKSMIADVVLEETTYNEVVLFGK